MDTSPFFSTHVPIFEGNREYMTFLSKLFVIKDMTKACLVLCPFQINLQEKTTSFDSDVLEVYIQGCKYGRAVFAPLLVLTNGGQEMNVLIFTKDSHGKLDVERVKMQEGKERRNMVEDRIVDEQMEMICGKLGNEIGMFVDYTSHVTSLAMLYIVMRLEDVSKEPQQVQEEMTVLGERTDMLKLGKDLETEIASLAQFVNRDFLRKRVELMLLIDKVIDFLNSTSLVFGAGNRKELLENMLRVVNGAPDVKTMDYIHSLFTFTLRTLEDTSANAFDNVLHSLGHLMENFKGKQLTYDVYNQLMTTTTRAKN